MELVVFGLIFGSMMGCGIYFLILRPALKERAQEEAKEREHERVNSNSTVKDDGGV